MGPAGIVSALETVLGIGRPATAQVVRIAAMLGRMALDIDAHPAAFYAASFALDPWSTAREILSWRDGLIATGWTGSPTGFERLDALARLECEDLATGLYDRLRCVEAMIAAHGCRRISAITLVDERAHLEPCWARLMDLMENAGVTVAEGLKAVAASGGSDLAKAKAFLREGRIESLEGDGSLVFIEADTQILAADAVAQWLAAEEAAGQPEALVIAEDGNTAFLDKALAAHGLPTLGRSSASQWRGTLQILPLAFSIAWAPLNPRALLDLLNLPRSPIPRFAASRLGRALIKEPGTGAHIWADAWDGIRKVLLDRHKDDPNCEAAVAQLLEKWRGWTTGGLFERAFGMPRSQVLAIAQRVSAWAIEADAGKGDPLLLSLAGAANAVAQASSIIELEIFPALLVDRMIEQAMGDGCRNPAHIAQAGGLRSVKAPSAIWGPARTVIWWDFTGPGAKPGNRPWTRAEEAALKLTGCELPSVSRASDIASAAYMKPLFMASHQVLLVRPAMSAGAMSVSHPLAHQLDPLTRPASGTVSWRAESMLSNEHQPLSGRLLERLPGMVTAPPKAQRSWRLPGAVAERLSNRRESATSFERLADCQMRWMIKDVLRVSGGRYADLPRTDQLLGNLAHAVAAKVLQPGAVPVRANVLEQAKIAFEELLPAIAALLQMPEYAGELAAARSRVPAALADLAGLLHARGFEIIGTELSREATFGDLNVAGQIDLLVRHPVQGLAVVDLKWTRSPRRRLDELKEGRAIQLATYGAIADETSLAHAPGAYYLLNQKRLIAATGSIVADENVETTRSLPETWDDLVATWRHWRDMALAGDLVAAGIADDEDASPSPPLQSSAAPCTYCEFTALCGIAVLEN